MHFYRTLKPFYAISFDLDNTLYFNNPIIINAEKKSITFLKKYYPALHKLKLNDYYTSRLSVLDANPNIFHNVNTWRWESVQKILLKFGLNRYESQLGADQTMDIIIYWRNKINITVKTHNILAALNSKWPLIAITNGNANPISYGLNQYFYDILIAGKNGRAKPHTDMFYLASKKLGIACKHILHVGDNLITDIQGAINANMQSCLINQYYPINKSYNSQNIRLLPHFEISELNSLTHFL